MGDFPSVYNFLHDKFPEVKIDNIKIYLVEAEELEKAEFYDVLGCCFLSKRIILVPFNLQTYISKPVTPFEEALLKQINCQVQIEDIVLRHLLQFVWPKIEPGLFRNEQEFFYLQAIEYSSKRGLPASTESLRFLGICDVLGDVSLMQQLFDVIATLNKPEITAAPKLLHNPRKSVKFATDFREMLSGLISEEGSRKVKHFTMMYNRREVEVKKLRTIDRFSTLSW